MGSGVIELIEKKSERRGKMEEWDRCLDVRERQVMIVVGKKKESMCRVEWKRWVNSYDGMNEKVEMVMRER